MIFYYNTGFMPMPMLYINTQYMKKSIIHISLNIVSLRWLSTQI